MYKGVVIKQLVKKQIKSQFCLEFITLNKLNITVDSPKLYALQSVTVYEIKYV